MVEYTFFLTREEIEQLYSLGVDEDLALLDELTVYRDENGNYIFIYEPEETDE